MQKISWREAFYAYAPLILWIGLVFFLSSTQGAMSNTSRFIRPFLMWVFPSTPDEILAVYHGYIRKTAHVVLYAMLAFWASRAFWSAGKEILRRFWHVSAFVLVFAVAALDELNQSFNSARTGTFYDVLLDSGGGLLMIFALLIFFKFRTKISPQRHGEHGEK